MYKVSHRVVLVVTLLVVLGVGTCLAADPSLTGSWNVEIGMSPLQTSPFSSFSSTLEIGLCAAFLELASTSDFLFSGWLWQEFSLAASLGYVSFDGMMLFEPQTGSFLYAQAVLGIDFSPIQMRLYSAMVPPSVYGVWKNGYVFDIYGELPGGIASVEAAVFLGADLSGISFTKTTSQTAAQTPSYAVWNLLTKTYTTDPTATSCGFSFSGAEFTFKATAFACVELTSITTFACTGFESQEVELSFVHLFGIPLTLTLDYVFELQTASHTFIPSLETDYGCVKAYTNIVQNGSILTGLEFYGIAFQATFVGATFTSISNLDTTKYVITTPEYGMIVEPLAEAIAEGHLYYPQEFWEVISVVVEIPPAGCGSTFSLHTFFSTSTGLLFDWGRSKMKATFSNGGFFSISSGVVIDTTGFNEWTIGMSVTW
ncbi:MAG TPA: hypothetical protein VMX15_01730 [Candidatus Heimdallarchaeota archaeon]|nr:hypothetical protein [Candidatus Heimdallarchaeota archaeon]